MDSYTNPVRVLDKTEREIERDGILNQISSLQNLCCGYSLESSL